MHGSAQEVGISRELTLGQPADEEQGYTHESNRGKTHTLSSDDIHERCPNKGGEQTPSRQNDIPPKDD